VQLCVRLVEHQGRVEGSECLLQSPQPFQRRRLVDEGGPVPGIDPEDLVADLHHLLLVPLGHQRRPLQLQDAHVLGLHLQRPVVGADGLDEAAQSELGHAPVDPGQLVLRFDLHDAVADLDYVLVPPQCLQTALLGRQHLQVLGPHLQGLVERGDGLLMPGQLGQHLAAAGMHEAPLLVQCQGLVVAGQGLLVPLQPFQGDALADPDVLVLGVQRQGLVVADEGLLEAAQALQGKPLLIEQPLLLRGDGDRPLVGLHRLLEPLEHEQGIGLNAPQDQPARVVDGSLHRPRQCLLEPFQRKERDGYPHGRIHVVGVQCQDLGVETDGLLPSAEAVEGHRPVEEGGLVVRAQTQQPVGGIRHILVPAGALEAFPERLEHHEVLGPYPQAALEGPDGLGDVPQPCLGLAQVLECWQVVGLYRELGLAQGDHLLVPLALGEERPAAVQDLEVPGECP